ncbi:lipase family protein [Sorangium sp. So ce1000]|uniref:lipase family protein n=1 Tax=Sorangium sp. So ce1000 TaxID=3133325 RepID=UPI003F644644
MKNKHLRPDHDVPNSADDIRVADTLQRAMALFPEEWAGAAARTRTDDPVTRLANVSPGAYDREAASFLAATSAWAYSSGDEVVRMLERRRFSSICVQAQFENQGFLMDSLVHLIQSRDGRVLILSFRGSKLTPPINWLANINAKPDPFEGAGHVHGSFYRGVLSVWPQVRDGLIAAMRGKTICHAWERDMRAKSCPPGFSTDAISSPCEAASSLLEHDHQRLHQAKLRHLVGALEEALRFKPQALYITGHSLGGAMAVLAAALIYSDEELRELRTLLRGIYTFGQPMVGDKAFARAFETAFGNKLFRHVYARDVVPHLPPRTTGIFEHFGQEYRSELSGWVRQEGPIVGQTSFGGFALTAGMVAWLWDQFGPGVSSEFRSVAWLMENIVPPFLRHLFRLRYSVADHMPINYLRLSRAVPPGSEFL